MKRMPCLDLRTCGCGQHEAFVNQEKGCVSCSTLRLHCPGKGSQVESAKPLNGFIRLKHHARAYQCLKPSKRCTPATPPHGMNAVETEDGNSSNVCQGNYTGKMCMECAEQFYALGQRCEQCPQAPIPDAVLFPLVAACLSGFGFPLRQSKRCCRPAFEAVFAVASGLAAFGLWRWMSAEANAAPSRRNVLIKQLKAQAPLLLQMCHWACGQAFGKLRPALGCSGSFGFTHTGRSRGTRRRQQYIHLLGDPLRAVPSTLNHEHEGRPLLTMQVCA